jgi:very-short-patch-repair endonuclease
MKAFTPIARDLRRNQTSAEQLFWLKVKNRKLAGLKFRRQVEIEKYIVDFVCFEKRLIIELDGNYHGYEQVMKQDDQRSEFLEGKGFMVLRYQNDEVMKNIEGVLLDVMQAANTLTPTLSLKGEGEKEVCHA